MTARCSTHVEKLCSRGTVTNALNGALRAAMTAAVCACSAAAWAGSCEVTAGALAFGAYQPLTFLSKLTSVNKDSTAEITVVCTDVEGGSSYSISLGEIGGSILNRSLSHVTSPGSTAMNFNVFINADRTVIWGNGTTGAPILGSIPGGNINESHTVYGRIPEGQHSLRVGQYNGQGTVTITYSP